MASKPSTDSLGNEWSLPLQESGDNPVNDISDKLNHLSVAVLSLSETKLDNASRTLVKEDVFKLVSQLQDGGLTLATLNRIAQSSLWSIIRLCLGHSKDLKDALTLWVKWCSLPSKYQPSQPILMDVSYWPSLLDAFRDCHGIPNLQKYCLFILRKSVSLLKDDVDTKSLHFKFHQKHLYVAAYNKYCTFFETIVIGRYMNQCEECIRQFPTRWDCVRPTLETDTYDSLEVSSDQNNQAENSNALVLAPWWTILFAAALQQANSDLIRKAVGTYVIEHYLPRAQLRSGGSESNRFDEFLTGSLLPWALHGQLLNKSIRRAHENVICDHGDRLASFCFKLASCAGRNSSPHVETILRYLVDNGNTRNVHAAGYIIQGFDLAPDWLANFEIAELAVILPDRIQFSQVQRSMVLHHCVSISKRFSSETLSDDDRQRLSDRLEVLLRRQQRLELLVESEMIQVQGNGNQTKRASPNGFDAEVLTLEEFDKQTKPVNGSCSHKPGTCLHGRALVAGCEYLLRILDYGAGLKPALILQSIVTVWFEVERQEFPRSVAELVPRILFHNQVIGYCKNDMDVKEAISQYTWSLWEVCKGKIYFWRPFTEAVREAFLHSPGVLELLKIEDIIVAFVNDPPTSNPEFLLDAALAKRERETCHNDIPIFSDESQGHICIFDILNHLRPENIFWAQELMDRLLRPWIQQKEPVAMVSKWKKTSQLQAILLLHESLRSFAHHTRNEDDKDRVHARALVDMYTLLSVLALEPLPRYRFLLEWMIIATALSTREDSLLCDSVLLTLVTADDSNPKNVASMITITMQLAINRSLNPSLNEVEDKSNSKRLTNDQAGFAELQSKLEALNIPSEIVQRLNESNIHPSASDSVSSILQEHETFTLRLLSHLSALMASPRIQIKHEAMWCFPILVEHATKSSFKSIISNPVLQSINSFIRSLEKFKNPPESRILESFDFSKDRHLKTLFQGGYLRIEPAEPSLVYAGDLQEMVGRRGDTVLEHGEGNLPFGPPVITPEVVSVTSGSTTSTHSPLPPNLIEPSASKIIPLQTKALNLDHTFTSPLADDIANIAHGNGPILIASLIENPHNLGGLSRVAEIFGCSSVHISDMLVLKKHDFKRVSVNSEDHINFHKTDAQHLVTELRNKRVEGWVIVGVEQTDSSVVIGMPGEDRDVRKVLPRKAIVVMGAEKTGIPADVLAECDVCVEIKQWGVTRSLNVQTAAACVLCEWRREWGGESADDGIGKENEEHEVLGLGVH
jgi:tRNA guanosine-2'-O-methyltransferase